MIDESLIVPADDKNFVGIGKMVFETKANWNIPHLHFMVDKTASNNFEATLIEFGLVSWSESEEEVIKSLVSQTLSYIHNVMQKTGFIEFITVVDSHTMDDYWRHYRKFEFTLARNGKDLSHKMDRQLVQEIKEMVLEELKNIIQKIVKDNADELAPAIERFYSLTPSEFTYNELKGAA
jgi:ribosomal protein S8